MCLNSMSKFLGPSQDLLASELPTLQNVLSLFQLELEKDPVSIVTFRRMRSVAREVCMRVVGQYLVANAKLVPPVILCENSVIAKIRR